MKDEQYEVVLNYIRRAQDALVAVVDELDEFGDKGDLRFAQEARALITQVNNFYCKVRNHQKVMYFASQGDALRAP